MVGENQLSKMSPDLHICTKTHTYDPYTTQARTHKHTANKQTIKPGVAAAEFAFNPG